MESILQNEKRISVCMATYNGKKYLRDQIESILVNLSEEDELIISDDGSTDGSKQILYEYAEIYNQIKILDGPGEGVIRNFENALRKATGDIVFLCDQDDEWEHNKVEIVKKHFEERSDILLIVHDAVVVDANSNVLISSFYGIRNSKSGFVKNIYKNSYIGCCMAFRRELLSYVLPIPVSVEMHDWWIGLLSDCKKGTLFIDDKLIKYRRHDKNVSKMEHYRLTKMLRNRCIMLFYVVERMLKIGQ